MRTSNIILIILLFLCIGAFVWVYNYGRDFDIDCLDTIALEVCQDKGFVSGKADISFFPPHSVNVKIPGDIPIMECVTGSRESSTKTLLYLEEKIKHCLK